MYRSCQKSTHFHDGMLKFHMNGPVSTQVQIVSPNNSITKMIKTSNICLYFLLLSMAGEEFQLTVKINGKTFGTYPFISYFDMEHIMVTVNQNNNSWEKFA